jgi:bifunctional DNA-binding transcriptional regulator/antitoxin component of YhaV-PrlF toxin-antitoxin module
MRKLKNKSVRKISKHSGSYSLTIPIEIMNELGWKEKQRVVVRKDGKGIKIADWKK